MIYLTFPSDEVFISPSFLKGVFTGYRVMDFFFHATPFWPSWFLIKKKKRSHSDCSLTCNTFFFSSYFQEFVFKFSAVRVWCVWAWILIRFIIDGVLYRFVPLAKLGKFLAIISSENVFSLHPFSSSRPFAVILQVSEAVNYFLIVFLCCSDWINVIDSCCF